MLTMQQVVWRVEIRSTIKEHFTSDTPPDEWIPKCGVCQKKVATYVACETLTNWETEGYGLLPRLWLCEKCKEELERAFKAWNAKSE